MFKQQKGITLIALVITIIVLLILAGVTIAMLTGSDSAPVKANEAKQKQDIGAAKDQVYIWAQDAQTTAYENVYVKAKGADGTSELATSKTGKANDIGDYVGEVVGEKATGDGEDVGLATIKTTNTSASPATASIGTSGDDISSTATITITTTDFTLTGYIDRDAGRLVWVDNGEIKSK